VGDLFMSFHTRQVSRNAAGRAALEDGQRGLGAAGRRADCGRGRNTSAIAVDAEQRWRDGLYDCGGR
jgi:hypothetical protein